VRRMKNVLWAVLVATACGSAQSENLNNGDNGQLEFTGTETPIPVEQAVLLGIDRVEDGSSQCSPSLTLYGIGGGSCAVSGDHQPLSSITSAVCENDGCTVTIVDVGTLAVTGHVAGPARLHVSAMLADGSTVEDFKALSFAAIDSIQVTSDDPSRCIGSRAIFVGAALNLSPTPFAGRTQVPREVEVSSEPAGVVTVVTNTTSGAWTGGFWPRSTVTVTAKSPGTATVHFKSGAFETVRTIRVAAVSDAVEGHLYRASNSLGFDVQDEPLAGRARSPVADDSELVVAWTLNDGTLALGGAENVVADPASFAELVTAADPFDSAPGSLFTTFTVYPSDVETGNSATLSGSLGAAMLNETLSW
jgi:hypothetical protein